MQFGLFDRTLGVQAYGFTSTLQRIRTRGEELRVTSNLALHESSLFLMVHNAMLEAENNSEEPEKWMAVL